MSAELNIKAAKLRLTILNCAVAAGKGHVPPAFSCLDIMVALYYGGCLSVDPACPTNPQRDRFILSKGHACLSLYAILSDLGFFPVQELDHFAQDGALLPGHPDLEIPGVEAISGSLGHGLGLGCGMALAARMNREAWNTVVLLGDGECQEGSIWEAAMFAGQQRLQNLVAIVDYNKLGATNFLDKVVSLEPIVDRWASFGWHCLEVDGHDMAAVQQAFADRVKDKPTVIVAHTIKGKGVDFMEASPSWHHQLPKGEQRQAAFDQLAATLDALISGEVTP